jgi:two-component system, OmpR family, sensor histidine kinase QseC
MPTFLPPFDQHGYRNFEYQGQPWRSLVTETADGVYRIQVAHSQELRDKEAFEIASNTVAPLGLLFPLLIALIYFSVRHGLKPLDSLAAEVGARSPDNLHTLAASKAPLEAMPLVASLNRLLGRLGTAIDNERRFTADAAHELRTPLAALKVQAQVALASTDPESRQHALSQVVAGVDRTTPSGRTTAASGPTRPDPATAHALPSRPRRSGPRPGRRRPAARRSQDANTRLPGPDD